MAITSEATTTWQGTLFEGTGEVALESSNQGPFTVNWKARSEGSSSITTPEELLAAAHSACFDMAFAHALAENGTPATSIETTAAVGFEPGKGITGSHLTVNATVPGIGQDDFDRLVQDAKANCPVSAALSIPITLDATLAQ